MKLNLGECDGMDVPRNERKKTTEKLSVEGFRHIRDVMRSMGKFSLPRRRRLRGDKKQVKLW